MPGCAMWLALPWRNFRQVWLGLAVHALAAAVAAGSEQGCQDTPGWSNGYTACNNYLPVDPDCHKDGVHCHFYKAHPDFCAKGMNDPWMNCCTCGGGSTFNGVRPTTPGDSEFDGIPPEPTPPTSCT
ncbi:fabB [Symbiodinium natans]|uniref:FabB protein n=1 Tax=Symbiodinium natans TaxID=878477 RepID=A0A812QEK8_9DINO|nr:fabB [Symbiodinium natans]